MPTKKTVPGNNTISAAAAAPSVTTPAPADDSGTPTSTSTVAAGTDPGVNASDLVASVGPPATGGPDCGGDNRQLDELLDAAQTLTGMFMPNATAAMDPDAPNVIMVKAGLLGRQRAFVLLEMQRAVERLNAAIAAASG